MYSQGWPELLLQGSSENDGISNVTVCFASPPPKAIMFPTEYAETIYTMCDGVRNGLRCRKISLITSFGLSKACR